MRRTAARPISRLLVVAVLAIALLGTLTRASWASDVTYAAAENAFTGTMNAERTGRGLRPLTVSLQLTRVARAWSDQMAADGTLAHNPRLAADVAGTWTRLGENVGYSTRDGASPAALVSRLHASFMTSPRHRANIMGDFNQVGVGVVMAGDTMWVTVTFSRDRSLIPNDAVSDAVRASRRLYAAAGHGGRRASHVVVTPSDLPSAGLPAITAAGGEGPLLQTHPANAWDPSPVLHPFTRAEIDRVLAGRGVVYVVGDRSAVSDRAVDELIGDGYTVRRVTR